MPGGLEAAGDVIAGGLIARAIEPKAGESVVETEANCLNCGTLVSGRYCQNCGQSLHVHRTLTAFWHDLVHTVFHFDGKFFRTIPMLAWKPGDLTRRYVRGERVKFISPLALFLFSFFLMFAAFSWIGSPFVSQEENTASMAVQAGKELSGDLAKAKVELSRLKSERASAIAGGASVKALDSRIASVQQDIANGPENHDQRDQPAIGAACLKRRIDRQQADARAFPCDRERPGHARRTNIEIAGAGNHCPDQRYARQRPLLVHGISPPAFSIETP